MKCTTHHHACDCRELRFWQLAIENARLREVLLFALTESGCDGDLCAHEWHQKAREALGEVASFRVCASSGCTKTAAWLVPWPGQPRMMCDECAAGALGVAKAMGLELAPVPL